MKTLDQHNNERWALHNAMVDVMQPRPNGIECPKCGKELWDSDPTLTLASNPPQKNVHCQSCGHRGYRLA